MLRKTDVVKHFGENYAAVARAFGPIIGKPISRAAVRQWGEYVPELKARQLLEHYPALQEYVVDPVTLLSARETRARLAPKEGLAHG